MSRAIVGCGAVVDTLLSGASLFANAELCWAGALVAALGVLSPIAFVAATLAAEAFSQPEVLTPPK